MQASDMPVVIAGVHVSEDAETTDGVAAPATTSSAPGCCRPPPRHCTERGEGPLQGEPTVADMVHLGLRLTPHGHLVCEPAGDAPGMGEAAAAHLQAAFTR